MAAWGGAANAWANEVEEAEAKGERLGPIMSGPLGDNLPSLQEANKVQEKSAPKAGGKKGKKSKGVAMTLDSFLNSGGSNSGGGGGGGGLMNLPSAPRVHDDDEPLPGARDYTSLGGAFKDYGGDRNRGGGDRYGDRDRGYGGDDRRERGGEDRERGERGERGERRRGGYDDEDRMPSRADTDDKWEKKFVPTEPPRRGGGGFDDDRRGGYDDRRGGRDDRRGGGFDDDRYGDRERRGGDREDREDMGPSRADEDSNWGSNKKFVPSEPRESRDRYDEGPRRGGFDDRRGGDRYDDGPRRGGDRYDDRRGGDRYDDGPRRGGGFNDRDAEWGRDRNSEREGDDGTWRRNDPAPAPTVERPRLNLAKRTLPVEAPVVAPVTPDKEEEEEVASKPKSNPFGGAKPVAVNDPPAKPVEKEPVRERAPPPREPEPREDRPAERPKLQLKARSVADPPAAPVSGGGAMFGGARPREDVLTEQGRDWRKEEKALARVNRPESKEEKALKEEISELRQKVEDGEGEEMVPAPAPSVDEEGNPAAKQPPRTVSEQLEAKEQELEKLVVELDDKVRYTRKVEESAEGGAPPPPTEGDAKPRGGDRREPRGDRREDRGERRGGGPAAGDGWEEPRRKERGGRGPRAQDGEERRDRGPGPDGWEVAARKK